jgi:hypothetical protein
VRQVAREGVVPGVGVFQVRGDQLAEDRGVDVFQVRPSRSLYALRSVLGFQVQDTVKNQVIEARFFPY